MIDAAVRPPSTGEVRVLLIPYIYGTGLNLQRASHVILWDHEVDPAKTAQTIGRVNRIGQQHPTFTVSFVSTLLRQQPDAPAVAKTPDQLLWDICRARESGSDGGKDLSLEEMLRVLGVESDHRV